MRSRVSEVIRAPVTLTIVPYPPNPKSGADSARLVGVVGRGRSIVRMSERTQKLIDVIEKLAQRNQEIWEKSRELIGEQRKISKQLTELRQELEAVKQDDTAKRKEGRR